MIVDELTAFEGRLRALRAAVKNAGTSRVNRKNLRSEAEALSVHWFTSLKPALEVLHVDLSSSIADMDPQMEKLHQISRPNNLASSYESTLVAALKSFKDRFVKLVQLSAPKDDINQVLAGILAKIDSPEESSYMTEAVNCAKRGFWRASVVMGWCAAIDRIQQTVGRIGFDKFNVASTNLKNKTTGKYKNWTKGMQVASLSDLQAVFDTDLIAVLEEMQLLDSNEAERLKVCFHYRNQSAHPAKPPILDVHLAVFYTDIDAVVLSNSKFDPSIGN